jgi:hypothetical protein
MTHTPRLRTDARSAYKALIDDVDLADPDNEDCSLPRLSQLFVALNAGSEVWRASAHTQCSTLSSALNLSVCTEHCECHSDGQRVCDRWRAHSRAPSGSSASSTSPPWPT